MAERRGCGSALPVVSEGLVEPLDGVVARYICIPLSSRLDGFLSHSRLRLKHLSLTAVLIALASGCAAYLDGLVAAGLLAFTAFLTSWLGWRQAERFGASKLWILAGSILDRVGEAFIISGMAASPSIMGGPWRLIGILALAGSLSVSYTAVRGGREYKGFAWRGFSAYGATRDVRFTVIAFSSILESPSLGLTVLAVLTLTVVVKRLVDLLSLG